MSVPAGPCTVAQALTAAQEAGLERLEAQTLLGHVMQRDRAWLIAHGAAHDPETLSAAQQQTFHALLQRRAQGEPMAYLLGYQEFYGLRLHLSPATLVPRPDTETLVDWALTRLPPAGHVVDLGTGSGAIALALKHQRPHATVTATDRSADALAVAQANGQRLGLAVQWLHGSWWEPLARRRFHLIVSNPPYIAGDDPHLPALRHEPKDALTPGGDGLAALRELATGAPAHLLPGGSVLLEHGFDQGPAVAALLAQAGFESVEPRHDLAGHWRCTGARVGSFFGA